MMILMLTIMTIPIITIMMIMKISATVMIQTMGAQFTAFFRQTKDQQIEICRKNITILKN